jgi:hypothetical protein
MEPESGSGRRRVTCTLLVHGFAWWAVRSTEVYADSSSATPGPHCMTGTWIFGGPLIQGASGGANAISPTR